MAIGLTTEQLLAVYLESAMKRIKELEIESTTADAGLNPKWQEFRQLVKGRYPDFNLEQFMGVLSIAAAFMDCIVRNNEAIAKTIPHLDA